MNKRLLLFATLLIIFVGGISIFLLNKKVTSNPKEKTSSSVAQAKIKVATVPVKIFHLPIIVAQQKGFFKKYNLDVNFQVVTKNLPNVLVGGQVDVALGAPYVFLLSNLEGANVSWIGSATNDQSLVIISSKELKDVKTVGALGLTARLIAKTLLEKLNANNAITYQDIDSYSIGLEAVTSKKIDAVLVPYTDWLIFKNKNQFSENEYKVLIKTKDSVDSQILPVGIVINNNFLLKNRTAVEDFSKAIIETTAWIRNNRNGAIDIFSNYAKVNKDTASIYVDDYIDVTKNLDFTPQEGKAKVMLDLAAGINPKAKNYPINQFVSQDISNSLSKEGFLKQFGFQ